MTLLAREEFRPPTRPDIFRTSTFSACMERFEPVKEMKKDWLEKANFSWNIKNKN